MSWTETFPVLSDEMVEYYQENVSLEDRAIHDEWFAIDRVINRRKSGHIAAFSLFWKHAKQAEGELPALSREMLVNAEDRGLVKRFAPWEHYVQPLLDGASRIRNARRDVSFRVYLAADLDFLIDDLAEAGCEVYLMKSSSLRHNPGAMWRFLALEEHGKLVTVSDADRARDLESDVERTELMSKSGLGFWRVPVWGELNDLRRMNYRPILACQMGSRKAIPAKLLMKALIWHTQCGTIDTDCKPPGCGKQLIYGTNWPDYGFDEWFLQAAVYPRVARNGILSFVPANAKSRLLPLDIEYCTWANNRAEIIYFGTESGCCAPPDAAGHRRKSNGRILLTGVWQVKTDNDVALIHELCAHAQSQDVLVEIKPVLHVLNNAACRLLPDWLLECSVKWEGLACSASVRRALLHAICQGHEAEWVWQASIDERVDFACVGGLGAAMRRADRSLADYVPGEGMDRIAYGGILPAIAVGEPLASQFPCALHAVKRLERHRRMKIALHRRDCLTGIGNCDPEDHSKVRADWSIPVWHFKWHSDCKRDGPDNPDKNRRLELEECLQNPIDRDGVVSVDWSRLPAAAWPKIKPAWRRGFYPVGSGMPVQRGRLNGRPPAAART